MINTIGQCVLLAANSIALPSVPIFTGGGLSLAQSCGTVSFDPVPSGHWRTDVQSGPCIEPSMSNTILVEVTRGPRVESIHRVSYAVVDSDGRIVASGGDIDTPVFPRSAVKCIQALPLFESGAADRYQFTTQEIALAVSSHSGEKRHVETAAGILAKVGQDENCLECGAHWPMGESANRELAADGRRPSALHNNCSGKHAGFICAACALDENPRGYVTPEHRIQRDIKTAMEEMTGLKLGEDVHGTDGCAIPTYAIPLRKLGKAFARIGTGRELDPARARIFERIRHAVAEHPFMVAGTGRFDTEVMTLLGARAFIKTGAEGVYCGALPGPGLGIALKCDDGTTRASQAAMAGLLKAYLPMSETERDKLTGAEPHVLRNWNKHIVGEIRVKIE
jgi:L-asparaginase II